AVGDEVADQLHDEKDAEGKGSEQAAEGQETSEEKSGEEKAPEETSAEASEEAPSIGAKLQGIGLKIYRGPEDKQKIKELAEKEALRLLEEAKKNEEGITDALTAAATANGGQMKGLEHRLKGLDSLARKIADRAEVQTKKMPVEDAVKETVAKIN